MSSDLESKPSLDRSTLLPILIGVFSLFGIIMVLLLGRFNASRNSAPAPETATPFRYLLIGTEPGIFTAETATEPGEFTGDTGSDAPDGSSITSTSPGFSVTAQAGKPKSSSTPSSGNVLSATKTLSSVIKTATIDNSNPIIVLNPGTQKPTSTPFPVIFSSHTPTRTPGPTITVTPSRTKSATTTSVTPCPPSGLSTPTVYLSLIPATYDDEYLMLNYGSGWNCQVVSNAYQSTLHVSNTVGSTITFSFTGDELRLNFQGGSTLGYLEITVSGQSFELDQANSTNEWVYTLPEGSPANTVYTVTLTHLRGNSVNLDKIIIAEINP